MQLPARRGPTLRIHLVEPIAQIDADRPQRRHYRGPESGPTEEPRGVPLPGGPIDVSRIEERVHIERLADPGTGLDGERRERLAEGVRARLVAARPWIEAVGGDGELVIPAQRDAVLDASQGVELREERPGVAKDETRL